MLRDISIDAMLGLRYVYNRNTTNTVIYELRYGTVLYGVRYAATLHLVSQAGT
jgi:hypothetical protein